MFMSLIVITREAGPRLEYCLAAVGAHRPPAEELVVVFDDPGAPAIPERFMKSTLGKPNIVRGRGIGRAAARNDGARAARGDILVFIDGDMLTPPNLIASHRRALDCSDGVVRGRIKELLGAAACRDLAIGGAGFPALSYSALATNGFAPNGYRVRSNLLEQGVEARFVQNETTIPSWLASAGANFSISRDLWDALGGQNERFGRYWGCEDLEFSYRAARNGRIEFAPDAIGYHLSHGQPSRWSDHRKTLDLFFELHPDPAVQALEHLLAIDGSLRRYRVALAG